MSTQSDKFERLVAKEINKIPHIKSMRPIRGTDYSDVLLEHKILKKKTWLEVKLTHDANLANPRIFYDGKKWDTNAKGSIARHVIDIANRSTEVKMFISDLKKFTSMDELTIPSSLAQLKRDRIAVPFNLMKDYFKRPGINQNISENKTINLETVLTEYYLKGKTEAVHYLQAKDDFYRIGTQNPFKVPTSVPILKGLGNIQIRISIRSNGFYEVVPRIVVKSFKPSPYSVMSGSSKENPFFSKNDIGNNANKYLKYV